MTTTLKDKIVDVVRSSEGIDKKSISESTSAKGIVLEGALSKLVKDEILTVEDREGQKFYFISPEKTETATLVENNVAESDVVPLDSGKKGSKKGKKEKSEDKSSDEVSLTEKLPNKKGQIEGGRDMRKFKFKGEQFTKGGLVHAVVAEFVAKHKNIGIAKLKESFPDELIQRFGVFQEISKAKQFASGGRDRYFMQDEKIIKLKDKRIAVCNQWTAENIKPFLTAARKLGFEIR